MSSLEGVLVALVVVGPAHQRGQHVGHLVALEIGPLDQLGGHLLDPDLLEAGPVDERLEHVVDRVGLWSEHHVLPYLGGSAAWSGVAA